MFLVLESLNFSKSTIVCVQRGLSYQNDQIYYKTECSKHHEELGHSVQDV